MEEKVYRCYSAPETDSMRVGAIPNVGGATVFNRTMKGAQDARNILLSRDDTLDLGLRLVRHAIDAGGADAEVLLTKIRLLCQ